MSDEELKQTIKLQINKKVGTDSRGRTVWTKPVEPTEFELVSTVMLQRILDSDDEVRKQHLRDAAMGEDGVLAQDTSSNRFAIVSDEDLRVALAAANEESGKARPADVMYEPEEGPSGVEELSLVTTQVLRKMLGKPDLAARSESDRKAKPAKRDSQGGYNPYDTG